jgi:precorrin-2 dehydrogenase/sirohydrochlorin ferrochelatase
VSAYFIALEGARIDALIVGGGAVAERKARALHDAGAHVRVVAPAPCAGLRALADERLTIVERSFADGDIGTATLVLAATDQAEVNRRVAVAAQAVGRLVNVVDDATGGTFVTVATHRAGDLVVAVTAGGVPGIAARVRDALAQRFDARYARAVDSLSALRRRLLDAGRRDDWHRAADELLGETFCDAVESGTLTQELAAWL